MTLRVMPDARIRAGAGVAGVRSYALCRLLGCRRYNGTSWSSALNHISEMRHVEHFKSRF